jgi:menaquinone-dependent protoporphyrinogen oxidase
MNVLVTVASKHGATGEIGEALAATLRDAGLPVETVAPEKVTALDGFDVVILGSAVYAGHWMESATRFAGHFATELAGRQVWLFSSGPIGHPPKPEGEPSVMLELAERVGARGHRSFAGLLDRRRLGLMERAITSALNAPEGDFRDWEAIRAWADEIAAQLVTPARIAQMFRGVQAAGGANRSAVPNVSAPEPIR